MKHSESAPRLYVWAQFSGTGARHHDDQEGHGRRDSSSRWYMRMLGGRGHNLCRSPALVMTEALPLHGLVFVFVAPQG